MATKAKSTFTPTQIAILARQIALYLPKAAAASAVGAIQFRRRSKAKNSKYVNPIVVDTSVLIDGRLIDVVKTGFLFGTLIVIPSVVSELHSLADSADDLKRARGRRGLEMLEGLRREKAAKLEVLRTEPRDKMVDDKIVSQSRNMKGKILTLDFNLNKVARVKGVAVLNLNDLANAIKTVVLPHEVLEVEVKTRGKAKDQGVAYLPDGTMVVVEGGSNLVGKSAKVLVLRVLQTAAGKMIFARPS